MAGETLGPLPAFGGPDAQRFMFVGTNTLGFLPQAGGGGSGPVIPTSGQTFPRGQGST